jgi:hypothetical protein
MTYEWKIRENAGKILVENCKERNHSEDLGIDVRIILKYVSISRMGGC